MSEVKVNKISPRSGTTVTLGDSGDTFTIPSGASITNSGTASGFGATGAVSWNTTVKTGDFTAVAGEGYFVDTSSGEIDVTLPASPSAGAVVGVKDYANTWDTNNCILLRNGSNIGGNALNSTLSTEGLAVTLVYVDATKGWLVTDSGLQSEAPGPEYVTASGGTPSTVGDFKIHTFTGPGTFTVSAAGNAAGNNKVEYLVIAGGGGGGNGYGGGYCGGGGGAGGYRESPGTTAGSYTVSPLGASPAAAIEVTAQGYPIAVGSGGSGSTSTSGLAGTSGIASSALGIVSAGGGGGGGGGRDVNSDAKTGGSGGGGGSGTGYPGTPAGVGGSGNTPPVNPPQGQNGGAGPGLANNSGGGGGGAGAVGGNWSPSCNGGTGGAGVTSNITNTPTQRAGGGGGSGANTQGSGGAGGGGSGAKSPDSTAAVAGTVNTGSGGGGGQSVPTNATAGPGAQGGSGLVVLRYKFQN